MLGSFLRESAVLLFVFTPLEQAIRGEMRFWVQFAGLSVAMIFLALGIYVEKRRYP
jgi:hypothetical protein